MTIEIHNYQIIPDRVDLSTLVARKVDGSDHGQGQLEMLEATVQNQTELIAKLIEHMNLSDEVLTEMLGGWSERLKKVIK